MRDVQQTDPVTWADDVVAATIGALTPRADAERAGAMQAYMKDVAPFLGVTAPDRRDALKAAWQPLGRPTSTDDLADAASRLVAMTEREYAYAAADLIGAHVKLCGTAFLDDPVERLLTTTPWWDTVDLLGSAVVSPLAKRDPLGSRPTVLRWSGSGDRWLVRAAIQHQRGWRKSADVEFILALCSDHAGDPEFFVQKAIGWALRDLCRVDAGAVTAFVDGHPQLTRVATREADKGLARRN
jgi:3-methyladenine DNA glycosylase AlkD